MAGWRVGGVEISRIEEPGFELVLPQDEETTARLRELPWLRPSFVTDDLKLRIGSSALLLRAPDATVLVDPWLAFDDDDAFERRLAALKAAGCVPEEVDVVVNTHVDGIGANVQPGSGAPAFPAARYVVPAAELDAVRAGERGETGALLGIAEPVTAPFPLTEEITVEDLPGHNAGHVAVWVRSQGDSAVICGHAFLHPAQIASPEVTLEEHDADLLRRVRVELLESCARDGTILIGPLFASPGGGRIRSDSSGFALEP